MIYEFLFKYPAETFEAGRLVLASTWPIGILWSLLTVATLVLAAVLISRRSRMAMPRVATVWALQTSVIALVLLLLWQPSLEVERLKSRANSVAGVSFQYTDIPFGMFRKHANQKISNGIEVTQSILDVAAKLVNLSGCFSEIARKEILDELETYRKEYWRYTGRLAKIGLPPQIVMPLRALIEAINGKQPERIAFVVLRGSETRFQYVEPDWERNENDKVKNSD